MMQVQIPIVPSCVLRILHTFLYNPAPPSPHICNAEGNKIIDVKKNINKCVLWQFSQKVLARY